MIRQNAPGAPARMKPMTRMSLSVQLEGIADYWDTLARIEVAFAQDKDSAAIKTALWQPDGTGDITRNGDVIYIPWTRAETAKFRRNSVFYMDIRPSLKTGDDLTVGEHNEPLEIMMTWSIFGEAPL